MASKRTTLCVVLLASVLAGCGSYTRHDYLERAAGVCTSTLRSLRLLEQPQPDGPPAIRLQSLSAYLERALPLVRDEARRLSSLRRPGQTLARTRELDRYLAALTNAVDELAALAAAARSGDVLQVAADERALAADRLPALAAAYGLESCSNAKASYT